MWLWPNTYCSWCSSFHTRRCAIIFLPNWLDIRKKIIVLIHAHTLSRTTFTCKRCRFAQMCLCTRSTYGKSFVCVNEREHGNWTRLYNKQSYRVLRSSYVCAADTKPFLPLNINIIGDLVVVPNTSRTKIPLCVSLQTHRPPTFTVRSLCISFDWIFIFSTLEHFRCHSPLFTCAVRRSFSLVWILFTRMKWSAVTRSKLCSEWTNTEKTATRKNEQPKGISNGYADLLGAWMCEWVHIRPFGYWAM